MSVCHFGSFTRFLGKSSKQALHNGIQSSISRVSGTQLKGILSQVDKSHPSVTSSLVSQNRFFSNDGEKMLNTDKFIDEKRKVCLIVGAGAGIGEALTRRFTTEGYITVVARRDANALKNNVRKIESELLEQNKSLFEKTGPPSIIPITCDAREERQVLNLFDEVETNIGCIDVCIFNVGANISFPIVSTTSQKFYKCWEMACYSGFLVGREAAKSMLPRGSGTIIFTGATASIRGAATFAAFSVAKSGLRALSQSMARELGPKGIHVSHVVIDGAVDTPWIRQNFSEAIKKLPKDGLASPTDIADAYWHLATQKKSAWTHEMDLRPYCERF